MSASAKITDHCNFLRGEPRANNTIPQFNDGREAALHDYIFSQQSLDALRGNPAAVLAAINQFAATQKRMMILHAHKVKVMRQQLETMDPKPKVIIELGTYVGTSAVALGAMLKEWYPDANSQQGKDMCKVYSCELSEDFARIARDFVDLAGLGDLVEVCVGPAADTLQRLSSEGKVKTVDALLIDHWEKFYVSDLKVCEEMGLLREGSVVVADNTDMPGAPDYVEYVRGGGGGKVRYESKAYDTTNEKGVPVSCPKLNPGGGPIADSNRMSSK